MSLLQTTIRYAWRCELKDLQKAIPYLRKKMWENIFEQAKLHVSEAWSPVEQSEKATLKLGSSGFHTFITDTHAYFIAYGKTGVKDIQRTPPWLKSHVYWNDKVRPRNISQKQWLARAREWEAIAFDSTGTSWSKSRLDLPVLDAFCQDDMVQLERHFQKERDERMQLVTDQSATQVSS